MLHLLLKYDMNVKDPNDASLLEYGIDMYIDPAASISVQMRREGLD